jgi:hypothetical protein
MKDKIIELYQNKRELVVLQLFYLIISIALILGAGLLALIDQTLGNQILFFAFSTLAIFAVNIIAWALVRLILDQFTTKKTEKAEPTVKLASKKKA